MGNMFRRKGTEAVEQEHLPIEYITPKELFNMQNDQWSHFQIIDTRSIEEYQENCIDLSEHFSFADAASDLCDLSMYHNVVLYGNNETPDSASHNLYSNIVRRSKKTVGLVVRVSWLTSFNEYATNYPFMLTISKSYAKGTLYPSQITDSVFLSNLGVATNVNALEALGITHVVNCTPECTFANERKDIDSLSPAEIAYANNLEYLRIPVIDDRDVRIADYFDQATEFVQHALAKNEKDNICRVLVHCKHGQSRSATVLAAWLIRFQGHTASSAVQHMKACRPKVRPNEGFLSQLTEFEAKFLANA